VRRIAAFVRAQRGSATIEFALASVFLFGIIMVALDFGIYAQQSLKLAGAIEQGSVVAFNSRSSTTVDTGTITNYVSAVAGGTPTMAYKCNGATCSTTRDSKCLGALGVDGWPTFTDPSTSNGVSTCANGAIPGYYLVIRATRTYRAVVVPDRYLDGSTMQQQAVVRLT
jgi:Flp pilus assembly protein TadG